MLKKLWKQDFSALSRTLFPLQIGVLAGALGASLLMRIAIAVDHARAAGSSAHLANVLSGISMMIATLVGVAVFASVLVTLFIVLARFYNNLLGNEGYLTFTLPVTTGQILWSKLLTGIVWLLISFAVVCVSGLLFVAFGTADTGVINGGLLDFLRQCFQMLGEANQYVSVPLITLELLACFLAALAAQMLEFYFAIVVGGQVAQKHKLLAAIGMYLVINMAVGILRIYMGAGGFGILFGSVCLSGGMGDGMALFNKMVLTATVINLALSAGFFLWSRYLLGKRLNLQ